MPPSRWPTRKRAESAGSEQDGDAADQDFGVSTVSASFALLISPSVASSSASFSLTVTVASAASSSTSPPLTQTTPLSSSSLAPSPKRGSFFGSSPTPLHNDGHHTMSIPTSTSQTAATESQNSSSVLGPSSTTSSTSLTYSQPSSISTDPSSSTLPSTSSPQTLGATNSSSEALSTLTSTPRPSTIPGEQRLSFASGPEVWSSSSGSNASGSSAVTSLSAASVVLTSVTAVADDAGSNTGAPPRYTIVTSSSVIAVPITLGYTVSTSYTTTQVVSTSAIPNSLGAEGSHASSNATRTAIIGGVVGGVGGLILFVMLGLFLCVRWRRRQHAEPLGWETVHTSGLLRPATRAPRTPRTPNSPHTSNDVHSATSRAPSPQVSQVSHVSQYAIVTHANMTSPTRSLSGSARTNISPLLMVQTSPRSEESYHTAEDGDGADPFADPVAMARMRPRMPAASPTIRMSDTTLVDSNSLVNAFKNIDGQGIVSDSKQPQDPLLMPPPALTPLGSRVNRLSHSSLGESLPSPVGSVDTGCAM